MLFFAAGVDWVVAAGVADVAGSGVAAPLVLSGAVVDPFVPYVSDCTVVVEALDELESFAVVDVLSSAYVSVGMSVPVINKMTAIIITLTFLNRCIKNPFLM